MSPIGSSLVDAAVFLAFPLAWHFSLKVAREEETFEITEKEPCAITILYATCTGTSRSLAYKLMKRIQATTSVSVECMDVKNYEPEQLEKESLVLFLFSTWTDGTAPETAQIFHTWVEEAAHDFRVSKSLLENVKFSVFGLGGSVYGSNFCRAASDLTTNLIHLGATSVASTVRGDDSGDLTLQFSHWCSDLMDYLREHQDIYPPVKTRQVKHFVAKPQASIVPVAAPASPPTTAEEDEPEEEDLLNDAYIDSDSDAEAAPAPEKLTDMEDLATTATTATTEVKTGRDMVTKLQRKALTKEGYKIIGTHSAVKICRWTKNQLRGRGGCYKHTFYGITSYQCMEATPSLACANKCVFCWRHHKNPVGTEWRWSTDEPAMIVEGAIEEHRKMVYQMKGVPGVQQQRLKDANTVRHCALSLVGEPIMYPRINEMLRHLHERGISTFLVTNAQFPEAIRDLDPITQLYVSIDASTRESLKAIDRPLFKDFWERFMQSLDEMKLKQQRTVYRMTLVKSYNMAELHGYADLIEKGTPDFIEIKGVTYCGKSDASSLTMQNVPWHTEVCSYAEQLVAVLQERGSNYAIATEHEHSCCILLAREDKFKIDGTWHTWINYDRFTELITEYYATGKSFSTTDYMAPTPHWAVYQSKERGFDPVESRWKRNKKGNLVEIDYKATESGCG